MAKIQDREATVKTPVVEIKALTVSGKQVTLAVFRQLEERYLIDEDTLQLRGVPWGRVNYHVDCQEGDWEQGTTGSHLHVVWQEGDSLRRSAVFAGRGRVLAGYAGQNMRGRLWAFILPRLRVHSIAWEQIDRNGTSYTLSVGGSQISHVNWKTKRAIESYAAGDGDLKAVRHAVSQEQWVEPEWFNLDEPEALTAFRVAEKEYHELPARWKSLYGSLEALDQLFIAV